jgi:hypothetical protein
MSATAIVIAVLLAVSLVCGSLMVRAEPFAVKGPADSPSSRVVQFLAGFFCWPIAVTFLLFLVFLFWDLLLNDEFVKELMKEEAN